MRGGLSALGAAIDTRPLVDQSPADRRATAVRIISTLPSLIASVYHGHLRPPRPDLGHVDTE